MNSEESEIGTKTYILYMIRFKSFFKVAKGLEVCKKSSLQWLHADCKSKNIMYMETFVMPSCLKSYTR